MKFRFANTQVNTLNAVRCKVNRLPPLLHSDLWLLIINFYSYLIMAKNEQYLCRSIQISETQHRDGTNAMSN